MCRLKHHFCPNQKVQVIQAILIHMKKSRCTFLHLKSVQRSLPTFRMQLVDKQYMYNVTVKFLYFNTSWLGNYYAFQPTVFASSIYICICIFKCLCDVRWQQHMPGQLAFNSITASGDWSPYATVLEATIVAQSLLQASAVAICL